MRLWRLLTRTKEEGLGVEWLREAPWHYKSRWWG